MPPLRDFLPTTWPIRVAGALVIAGACLWVGLGARSCAGRHQGAAAAEKADAAGRAGDTAAANGDAHDQEAQAREPQLRDDAAEVARLRAEVARLRRPAPAQPAAPDAPAAPAEPQPVGPGVDLAAVVAGQDLLIAAQDRQIKDQAAQIHTLTLARDEWKLAAQSYQQQAVQEHARALAAEGVAKSQRWLGRIEGLVVGLGGGYIAGRLH